jgi:hypothetical protein
MTYDQKVAASLSPSSSDTQPTPAAPSGRLAIQSTISVDLPNPGGAETRVSRRSVPRRIRSVSRGRATTARRRCGTLSFVSITPGTRR